MEMEDSNQRKLPNVLITGTPGCGKSLHCTAIASVLQDSGLKVLNISEIVKEQKFFVEQDETRDCLVIDQDALCDYLEIELKNGNCIVDSHTLVDYFPERWFDLVLCLHVSNTLLFDRLKARGYNQCKIQENVECEIMQIIANEVNESYAKEIIQFLQSETKEDLESNVIRFKQWYESYIDNNTN